MKTLRNLTCLVLVLLPIVFLIYFVAQYKVDVPYWDQWEIASLLNKSFEGTLAFGDLWKQHNEHRPLFPLIIMLVLARLSNWNISYELAVNILLGIGIFSVFIYQLGKTDKSIGNRRVYWPVPIISLFIFCLPQYENWLWGWQIQVFLNVLAAIVGIVLLAGYAHKWLGFMLALFMGVIATYSFANGLVYWPVGLLMLFFC